MGRYASSEAHAGELLGTGRGGGGEGLMLEKGGRLV